MITTLPPATEFELGPPIIFPPCDSNYLQICECSCEIQDVLLEVVCTSEGEGGKVLILNMLLVQSDENMATGSAAVRPVEPQRHS